MAHAMAWLKVVGILKEVACVNILDEEDFITGCFAHE